MPSRAGIQIKNSHLGFVAQGTLVVVVDQNVTIAVLITSFNRPQTLRKCLEALSQNIDIRMKVTVFHVECSDPKLRLDVSPINFAHVSIEGDRTTYWAKGMRLAWEHMEIQGKFDYVLWLNEDTVLSPQALRILLDFSRLHINSVLVASTWSSRGQMTYGGIARKSWLKRLHFEPVTPSDVPVYCDTLNGNCVLVPENLDKKVRGFPKGYLHSRADIAFGLRIRRSGFSIISVPGKLAECESNDGIGYGVFSGKNLVDRITSLSDPKIGPMKDHLKFCLEFGGLLAPIYAIAPLVRVFLPNLGRKS